MEWAKYHPICKDYLFHIPNGGYRHIREAVKLKRMGVKAGVSDLFLAYPSGNKHGLFMEIKTEKGRLTQEQMVWLERIRSVGFDTHVTRNVEDAIDKIRSYLNYQ